MVRSPCIVTRSLNQTSSAKPAANAMTPSSREIETPPEWSRRSGILAYGFIDHRAQRGHDRLRCEPAFLDDVRYLGRIERLDVLLEFRHHRKHLAVAGEMTLVITRAYQVVGHDRGKLEREADRRMNFVLMRTLEGHRDHDVGA